MIMKKRKIFKWRRKKKIIIIIIIIISNSNRQFQGMATTTTIIIIIIIIKYCQDEWLEFLNEIGRRTVDRLNRSLRERLWVM